MRTDLSLGRHRLADRLLDQLDPSGMLRAPSRSRVLESALLLALLVREDVAPDQAELTRRYLKTTLDTDPPDPLQCAFGHAALDDVAETGTSVQEALSSFEHFSKGRKLLAFQTLLAELGAAEPPRDVPSDAFDADRQPSWLRLQMSALKVMSAPSTVTDADWACLEPALRAGPPWQACYFAQLVGLFALRKNPAYRPSVRRTLLRVAHQQLPGGGLPFITGLDVFATAIAGTALAGIIPGDPRLAVMADSLAGSQNQDGGFGFTRGVTQSDVDDSAYALGFLRTSATRQRASAIRATENYLLSQRNPDGGFPTFFRGAPSEVAMTAGAVTALAPNPAHRDVVRQGVAFIVNAGTAIERSWSRNATNVLFRTVLALGTLDDNAPAALVSAAHDARRRVWTYLSDSQNADGGWGHEHGDTSDPISTAYAAIGLAGAPEHRAVLNRAVAYLLAEQQSDGGYLSKPDQAGPRPLLYDTPVLADITVLLALVNVVEDS